VNAVRFLLLYTLVPIACAIISWWLGQDISWDIQNYHLYNPYAFLNDRQQLDLVPAGMQSQFVPFIDLFWFGLVKSLSPPVVGIIMGGLHGLNFVLLLFIARRLLPVGRGLTALAWVAALLGLLSVGFRSELGTGMQDNLVALFMLGSLLTVLNAADDSMPVMSVKKVFIAGLLAGVACACKLTIGSYALGLCFALGMNGIFPAFSREKSPGKSTGKPKGFRGMDLISPLYPAMIFGVGVLGSFLVLAGPLYYQNWQLFGNPVFPMYNALFGGDLASLEMIKDQRFVPRSAKAFLLRPILMSLNPQLVSELPYFQYTTMIAFLLLVFWLAVTGLKLKTSEAAAQLTPAHRLFLWYMLISFGLWMLLFSYYRYLISWELLAPLAMMLLLINMLGRSAGILVWWCALSLLTAINFFGAPDWGRSKWTEDYYRVERPADLPAVSTVLLMGTPLGWLVPAFDISVPFIQIDPNFPTGRSGYGREALQRIDSSGNIRVIYDASVYKRDQVNRKLQQGLYKLDADRCIPLTAWMGSQAFNYQYCPVQPAG